ncbi:MAG TPA: Ig-like domain-containing protein [Rhodoferax sp.]
MTAVSSDQTNRISTLTASCAACTASPATSQVNVVGASIALNNSGVSSLVVGGSSPTLNATVKDVFGVAMAGVTVSFAATDSAVLGLSAPTGVTNGSGVATVTVSALAAGSASINVSALGNAKSQAYASGVATAVLAVTSPANNAILVTNIAKTITVSAPGASTVTFATTLGTFNGATSQIVPVSGGIASADLISLQAGTASITMIDNLSPPRSVNLTLVVSPPVSAVNKILLSSSRTTLPIATAGNQSSLTLTARAVMLINSQTDQSVANVPIAFSMTGGPGAGEFLTPALAYTDSAGYAVATFTAGTAASIPNGIVISAKVQDSNPVVQTGTSLSSNDVQLTIGGQALSVAFGPASVLGESSDKTLYIQAYSVQVTDANNNPVSGQVVTLRMRPVAFSLGDACTFTATYCSEDWNANNSLESAVEDGVRIPTTVATAGTCPRVQADILKAAAVPAGTSDGILTPANSDGGSVPATVITDASGIAAFNLTYLKGSAIWIINRLTATVSSSGTETSKSTIFRLAPTVPDVGPPCSLPASPYSY